MIGDVRLSRRVLEADTIIASCGLENVERTSWSTQHRHDFGRSHDELATVADYDKYAESFEDNYPGVSDGRSAWMIDCRELEGMDQDKNLDMDSQLSPSVEKVATGALLHTSSVYKGSGGTRALPENPHVMHIFFAVGLAECTSNRTIHSLRACVCILRQMVMRSDYWQICRRWSGPANVELEFGDVFRLESRLNEWFLSLDLRQFRPSFFTQTVAPCRVEHSDDEGDDDLEGESENYICSLLDEDGNVVNVGRRHQRSLHINVTHRGERMENQRESQAWWSQISATGAVRHMPVLRQHPNMAATERHNRCVVDAGRFHCPVVDIPPDTICPRCDLIFNDTAELQRHLASTEYALPEGHA